jgi:hypothetical protein
MNRQRFFAAALTGTFLMAFAVQPVAAACVPFLCFFDLSAGGGTTCPNGAVYTQLQSHTTVTTSVNPNCTAANWRAVVARVQIPTDCTGVSVWVEYEGVPEGFSVNIGDSETNDGFAGDAGSLPTGQNAELQILHDNLSVFSAASAPPVDQLLQQQLALTNGSIKFLVENQSLTVGQPSTILATPSLENLYFLPNPVPAGGNRTVYVGLNRVISPINGQNTFRNGCGARRALLVLH